MLQNMQGRFVLVKYDEQKSCIISYGSERL